MDEPFACGGTPIWTLLPESGTGALSIAAPGLPPGPFGVGCALGFQAGEEPAGGVSAWGVESTATRGAFYLPTPPGDVVTLRVRLFEAASPGLDATRWVRLLDAVGAVWGEVSWDGPTSGLNAVAASGGAGGWEERVFEFQGVGPGPWSLQLALAPNAADTPSGPQKPTSPSATVWWWVDHLLVSTAAP